MIIKKLEKLKLDYRIDRFKIKSSTYTGWRIAIFKGAKLYSKSTELSKENMDNLDLIINNLNALVDDLVGEINEDAH